MISVRAVTRPVYFIIVQYYFLFIKVCACVCPMADKWKKHWHCLFSTWAKVSHRQPFVAELQPDKENISDILSIFNHWYSIDRKYSYLALLRHWMRKLTLLTVHFVVNNHLIILFLLTLNVNFYSLQSMESMLFFSVQTYTLSNQ